MAKSSADNSVLKVLPSIDLLLKTAAAERLLDELGAERVTVIARQVAEQLRAEMIGNSLVLPEARDGENGLRELLVKEAERRMIAWHKTEKARGLQKIINATGVILHTNLGRASLSPRARQALAAAAGYCNLEYDLGTGERGRRGARAEDLLAELTGAEAALIVNNCAAAAVLVLSTLASDGETIVSRGELVEIGGDFRVPDVMRESGTRMIEVGTTNRTRLSDYQNAISDHTRLLMRVHTSNYRIIGFTKTPALSDLAELAHERGLLLYEDAGSGALIDLKPQGITGEPVVCDSISAGADVISFSGDKLLGGPQAGLLVGRSQIIERMRKNPLYRALRADKLRLAALEATLEDYGREQNNPTQMMIALTQEQLRARAEDFVARLQNKVSNTIAVTMKPGESAVGGGSAPTSPLATMLVCLTDKERTANQIEAALRASEPPVLVRIHEDQVAIDLRTVAVDEEPALERALLNLV